uniref:Uncharacterized protein n=1 Tax=Papilio xuthus TaxID=66420 RepID=I4DQL9_PAPXU|nr:unknown unsecreted protein [Papilio xuthus]
MCVINCSFHLTKMAVAKYQQVNWLHFRKYTLKYFLLWYRINETFGSLDVAVIDYILILQQGSLGT